MILKSETKLYRYCLSENVPNIWDASFKNKEYTYNAMGNKNQIGAFFFYLNLETAENVSETAIRRMKMHFSKVTITNCSLIRDVNLLDISHCERPVNILNVLYDNGLYCLTNDFNKYDKEGKTSFLNVSNLYDVVIKKNLECDNLRDSSIIAAGTEIDKFFYGNKNYLGQLLTDFDNGKAFKTLLKDHGFDGYIFDEETTSPTVCLFDSSYLSEPDHKIENVLV